MIAKEVGHADQQVAQQSLDFARALAQHRHIRADLGDAMHLHAAADPAQHGRALIVAEIMAGAHAHQHEYLAQSNVLIAKRRLLR